MIKLLYKPWGMLAGMVGGALAGVFFKRVWKLLSGDEEAPRRPIAAADGSKSSWPLDSKERSSERSRPSSIEAVLPASRRRRARGRVRILMPIEAATTATHPEEFAAVDGPSELFGPSKKAVVRRR